jgi:O-antigen/teichoic acid export membrane protein
VAGAHAKPAGLRQPAARPGPAGHHRRGAGRGDGADAAADRGAAAAAGLTAEADQEERGRRQLAGVARGGTLNLAGAAFAAASTLAITVLITRHFSKQAAGAFFTATSVFLIAEAVASLGAFVGLVNFIAGLRKLGRERDIPAILRAAIVPVIAVSIVVAGVLLLVAGPLATLVLSGFPGHAGSSPATVTAALRALAIALPFAAVLDTLLGASRGYRDMRATVLIDRIGRPALQLAGVAVAVGAGAAGLLAPLWALPYLPAAGFAWLWLRRTRRRPPLAQPGAAGRRPAARRATALAANQLATADGRSFWRFTAPRALAALAQITIQRLDIVLVAILRGPGQAAVYTAATRFLVAGQFANTAISMAAQPRFAELFASGDRRGARQVYQATTGWLVLLTWPLYLLAVIYGPAVLSVFGHSYRAGSAVMVILGCTMLLATACGQVDVVLISSGRSGWSLANGLTAVIVNVGADLLLIPRYGIAGAAVGWAVAIAVTNLAPLAQLAVGDGLHPFGRGTLTAGTLCLLSFGAAPLLIRAVAGTGAGPTAAALGAGCALLAAGLWRFSGALQLSVMPGAAWLASRAGRLRRRAAQPPPGPEARIASESGPDSS